MERFDYVIVGGGAAGCVLAARLSERPANRVLLLEAGGDRFGFWVPIPAGFGRTWRDPRLNWGFRTAAEPGLFGREIAVPRGKGLGGSTLINGMIYARGQPLDYDLWAQAGCAGWSFGEVLPYFRRLEGFRDARPGDGRGRDGPLSIETVTEHCALAEAFLLAAEQAGLPRNPDYNGREQEGFGYYQATQRRGRRWSAHDAYLSPALSRPNLEVRTHAQALGLELEGRRVTGVRYRQNGVERVVRTDGEVVLAAGAVQSPQLLELSGIGDPAVLAAHGIRVRHPLAGVGRNYQDHFATRMNWRVTRPITLNEQSRGWRLALAVATYFVRRRGILTLGTGLVHGFVKTRPELATPDVQYFFVHASYANAADRVLDREPGMTIGVTQLRPGSRGTIHVKSADPLVPPAIRPNFLDDPADEATLVEGMKIARAIVAQPALRDHVAFEMNPGPEVVDDAGLAAFARRTGQTIYHPVGTCAMGVHEAAVVDPRLRVRGLQGLRVADASVIPRMVSGNTQAAVMMVAEKASDLIHEDRGGGAG